MIPFNFEASEKCISLIMLREGENFNHSNVKDILRIKFKPVVETEQKERIFKGFI